jgi:PAS domain S-box-containing protein
MLQAVLDAVPDPMWIVDRRLSVIARNPAFDKLTGAPSLDDLAARVLAGRTVSAEVRVSERRYVVTGTPSDDCAVFTARELSDLARTDRDESIELVITRFFDIDRALYETVDDVIAFLCESDGWDCGVLWLVDAGGTALHPATIWSRPGLDATKFRDRVAELHFARGRGIPGRAWSQDDVIWVADLFEESGMMRADGAARAGLHGAAAVPLHDADRIIGVLEMLTRAVRPISEQRRRALTRAGRALGRLIVRRQMQQLIERKGQEWSITFDAIELPIFIVHPDGSIARVNRAARDLAGGTFTDLLGRNIALTDREPWRTLADTVSAVRDSRTPCTAQIADGQRHWDVSASWTRSVEGDDERIIVVMRDVTDLVQLQESVRRGEQLAALGELVAGVAHEVRNPIFGMGLTVDALQTMLPDTPEFNELAGVLRTWLRRLNHLMENLLAYGKSWSLELQEGRLDEVMRASADAWKQLAEQREVQLDITIGENLVLLMDANRLTQAFENLVTNALQHSMPRQKIEIVAHAAEEGWVQCTVRDEGPGFNVVDLPRVFQPFFTRRRGGTGLGLSIVQRIVDEHGGTITAGNADQGGAIVTMRFPAYARS